MGAPGAPGGPGDLPGRAPRLPDIFQKNVKFLKGNILNDQTKREVIKNFKSKLDVIISDMAADTTGNKSLDSIRTNQLCSEAIDFSTKILKKNCVFAGIWKWDLDIFLKSQISKNNVLPMQIELMLS